MRILYKAIASVSMIALSTAAAIGIRRFTAARKARKAADDFVKANENDPDLEEPEYLKNSAETSNEANDAQVEENAENKASEEEK